MPKFEECRRRITSNDYADEIAGYYGSIGLLSGEECYQLVNEDFAVVHNLRQGEETRDTGDVSFFMPYCFGLLQQENLESIGVSRVRRIPGFDYRGSGIIIGIVDTGERVIIMSS